MKEVIDICELSLRISIENCYRLPAETNPSRAAPPFTQESEVLARIENWQRFFRLAQRIIAVPYYTPPELGDVMDEERIVKLPCNLQDAVRLELAWRNLLKPAEKWFIKWEYITRIPHPTLWRKLKHYNVIIKNTQDHQLFERASLRYFGSRLD